MNSDVLWRWLRALGYSDSPDALHLCTSTLPPHHPYHSELVDLLDPAGHICAKAVFDVEGVPTVCFFERDNQLADDTVADIVREGIWNQNLVSITLKVEETCAIALPSALREASPEIIQLSNAHPFSAFSSADIQSGELFKRHPEWFSPEKRVDRTLLKNLGLIVEKLNKQGIEKLKAQLLMAQVMFIAYLEHRGIVSDIYREDRQVDSLFNLVRSGDQSGILKLLERLKDDFNGDLLGPESGVDGVWGNLSPLAFALLDEFLMRVDLETRQQDLWGYDFRMIPVELLSGIYETFLSVEKRSVGAYYTPRHLAVLAVDQAFAHSSKILDEKVYDGACGSGILLTTAYRRMLAHAEANSGRQWSFAERVELLKNNIFGSDINESACRVTAFSLYLSVLEHLEPTDIAKLTAEGRSKLPNLLKSNIQAGETRGDFFSDENPHLQQKKCTIFLSNPPWVEPKKGELLSADRWAKNRGYKIPRRQLCAAFMLRALDSLQSEDGRLCFILPVSVLGASTSQSFVQDWLGLCEVDTIINFGDLRKLLFDEAKQPTLLVVARPRRKNKSSISNAETFEYWVPKADVSFAFGRLTLHGTDRHRVLTPRLAYDNSVLTTLFWGTSQDQAFLTRLQLMGNIEGLFGKGKGWHTAKGFHKHDASVQKPASSLPLRKMKHLDAKHFAIDGPLFDTGVLKTFPENIETVASLPEEMMASFDGPRIVFTDGMTPERQICAGFSMERFCFSSSMGVIQAPPEDADLLRFLSVYLHSDLIRYVLLLTAYQISFERERVTLRNIKDLPFVRPSKHKDPKRAYQIISEVAGYVKELEIIEQFERYRMYKSWQPKAEKLISEYFGITDSENERIREVINAVLPSVQPSSYLRLQTPLQARTTRKDFEIYQAKLVDELDQWRNAMGGAGNFQASVLLGPKQTYGAIGVVRLDVIPGHYGNSYYLNPNIADDAVIALIGRMKQLDLLPVRLHNNIYLIADYVIRVENSLYLIKPLVRRLWLQAEAVRDAERMVRFVQETPQA